MDRSLIRGADTQFVFDIPCNCTDVASAKVTFWQPENNGPDEFHLLPITRTINELTSAMIAEKKFKVVLTKEETLRFSDKRKAYVQIAITKTVSAGGACIPSKQEMITVYPARDELFTSTT